MASVAGFALLFVGAIIWGRMLIQVFRRPRETRLDTDQFGGVPKIRGGPRCEHPEHFCGAALEPGDDEALAEITDHLGPAWLRRMDRIARKGR